MSDVYSLLVVTVVTFVGTALDNLLMLTMLRVSGTASRDISAGFLSGSTVVLALCAAGTGLSSVLPVQHLGYLGVVPVTLGVVGLATALRGSRQTAKAGVRAGVSGIAMLQLGSSFDTLAAFLPLFADTSRPLSWVVAAGFAGMSLLWLLLSFALARLPGVTAAMRPIERFARPLVLVLVGVYILMNTGTDVEPDNPAEAVVSDRCIEVGPAGYSRSLRSSGESRFAATFEPGE
jgi:cadmium resistance protein CadD (predicted permease)